MSQAQVNGSTAGQGGDVKDRSPDRLGGDIKWLADQMRPVAGLSSDLPRPGSRHFAHAENTQLSAGKAA